MDDLPTFVVHDSPAVARRGGHKRVPFLGSVSDHDIPAAQQKRNKERDEATELQGVVSSGVLDYLFLDALAFPHDGLSMNPMGDFDGECLDPLSFSYSLVS